MDMSLDPLNARQAMDILDQLERAHSMSVSAPENRNTMYARAADEIRKLRAYLDRAEEALDQRYTE